MPIAPKRPPTTKPADSVQHLNMLVYGGTGVGKTHLVGTMAKDPAFGKILMLCPDPGTLTLAFDEDANRQIEIAKVSSVSDFDAWYEYLKVENPKTNEFQTLVIDGFTDVGELALREALDDAHDKDSNRDPNLPEIADWNKTGIQTRRIVRWFRDLPMMFVGTALAKEVTDVNGAIYITPSLPGKLAAELGAYVDIIGYLYADVEGPKEDRKVVRKLRTERTDKIQAKDRTRRLPSVISNPTMPELLYMLKNNPQRDAGLTNDLDIKMKKAQIKGK